MNAITERGTGGGRRKLLDRTLIRNQAHLHRILCQHETPHHQPRPHRCLNSAAPLKPLPEPADLEPYHVRRHARISGIINEYHLAARRGQRSRHPHRLYELTTRIGARMGSSSSMTPPAVTASGTGTAWGGGAE
jgi:hypothetical protein